MKRLSFFIVFLLLFSWLNARDIPRLPAHPGAAMDFDFTGVRGKTKFKDRTGKFTLISDTAPMLEEEGALRVSDSARLHIPCKNNEFGEKVSIVMWFLNTATPHQMDTPLLERGIQQEKPRSVVPLKRHTGLYDFTLYFTFNYPGFTIGRTGNDAVATEGIVAFGMVYDRSRTYYNKYYKRWPITIHNDPAKVVRKNYWQQIVATYDNGATKIYLDGKPIASVPTKRKEKFLTSGQDLVIGAFRSHSDLNKNTAEILVKSLVIFPKVLNDREVAGLFAKESPLFDIQRKRADLKITRHYYTKDRKMTDPELKTTLNISKKYMQKLPADPYKNNKNMTGSFNADGMYKINGELYPPVMANMYNPDQSLKRRKVITTDFAAAGIDVMAFNLYGIWLGEDKYNWKHLDNMLAMHVKACPTAKITVVVSLITPAWFKKKYPAENEMYVSQPMSKNPKIVPCPRTGSLLGSEKYKQVSEKYLKAFIRHCESGPYAKHIFGYQLFGGDAGEWYWSGLFCGSGATGYSEPTRRTFIKYLRKIYKNDVNALRKAWRNNKLTFETVKVPMPKYRVTSELGIFYNPAVSQDIIDVRRFQSERTAECFTSATKIIRENAPGKIVGIYNGYALLYSFKNLQYSGLQTLSAAIRSPYIDLISTPIDYEFRRYKMPGVNINGFNASAALHNKMIWREEDIPTHLTEKESNSRSGSLREALEVKRRAFGYTLASRSGFWYCWQMKLHGFHQNEIMEDSARMKKIADASVNRSRRSAAKVALIFDERDSLFYTNSRNYIKFFRACNWDIYREMHNSGIPFDMYFPDDLANPKMPDYKMYVFLNQWAVTDKLSAVIRKKLKKNNALAVWQYAPGFLNNARFDIKNMKRLTGIGFKMDVKTSIFAPKHIKYSSSPLVKGIASTETAVMSPSFTALAEPGTEILATAKGLNIMARNGRSVWTLLPLTTDLIRNLCKAENIHIYSDNGNTLLVNESYMMVHTLKDGPFTVRLPEARKVTECIRGKKFGKVKQFTENLPGGTTAIYLLEK